MNSVLATSGIGVMIKLGNVLSQLFSGISFLHEADIKAQRKLTELVTTQKEKLARGDS